MQEQSSTPWEHNPGSPEAKAQGCTCAVMDNRRGKGMYIDRNGDAIFVISGGCPLHSPEGRDE